MLKPSDPTYSVKTVTIAKDGSLSSAVQIAGYHFYGIVMPDTWDASTTLTFQCSHDGSTYQELQDDSGAAVSVSGAAASKNISLDSIALKLVPWNSIKIRSGTASSAVPQTAERTITVVMKE